MTLTGTPRNMSLRIALIGDIHAFSLKVQAKRLLSRRILAQSNLWLNRRHRFNHAMLEPLFERLQSLEPDLVLCSGDITTTSLEDEFLDVMRFFKPLAESVPMVVVPGNHDRYTFKSRRKKRMESLLEGLMPSDFPHVQTLRERWRLIALDSGIPNVLMSRGALGDQQFSALARDLGGLTERDGVIVLCHYPAQQPPGIPSSWAHNLAEASAVQQLLAECPARIVYMHGHIHQPWYWVAAVRNGHVAPTDSSPEGETASPEGLPKLAYLNAGSPCMTSANYPAGQGFWEVQLPEDPADDVQLWHHVPKPSTYGPKRMRRIAAKAAVDRPKWERHEVS